MARLEKFTEAQKDKRVLLAEAAGLVIATVAYKKRIWEDTGLIRRSAIAFLNTDDGVQETTSWAEFETARKLPATEAAAALAEKEDEEGLGVLTGLLERFQAAGGVLSDASVQIRNFRMGETSKQGGIIAGVLRFIRSDNPDKSAAIEIQDVQVDSGLHVDTEEEAIKLREAIVQLPQTESE